MEERKMANYYLGTEEYQSAIGNIKMELISIRDDYKHAKISKNDYLNRINALRTAGNRFHVQFQQGHHLATSPMRAEQWSLFHS
jgi:hypothetical protein